MRKWPLLLALSLSGLSLYTFAFAADENGAMPTAAAALVCMPLVQQGDAIPPKPTTHLDTLKICMNNCDTIYQPLAIRAISRKCCAARITAENHLTIYILPAWGRPSPIS